MAGGSSSSFVPDLPIFDGKDHFDGWQLNMKKNFKSQGLWYNVKKGILTSTDDDEEKRKDAHALYCIQQALVPTIFSLINNPALSAKDAWDILDVEYNKKHKFLADDDFTAAEILIMPDKDISDISLPSHCIKVIPNEIRELNPAAYTPQLISIGPLHHRIRRPHLLSMQNLKLRYAKRFLERTNKPKAFFVKFIQRHKVEIRDFYDSEPCKLDSRSYVEMILLDSFFILELIIRVNPWMCNDLELEWEDRGLLKKIKVDLLMFENQLPFLLLSQLYAFRHGQNKELRMDCRNFFLGDLLGFQRSHYIDNDNIDNDPLHFIHFIQCNLNSRRNNMPLPSDKPYLKNAAKNLSHSRVKFQLTESQGLTAICFKKRSLRLPRLVVDNMTERLFRNIMISERGLVMSNDTLIYSYLSFLHLLMQSDDDVSVLVEANVIENRLDNNQAVVELFKNLCGNINTCDQFYFYKICKDLDDYVISREGWYNNSKRILKDVYFSNVWTGTATIAAAILLLLTLSQTIMSFVQFFLG
ncbi:hypothetical protein ACFE04_009666 [Oxalis oulophora]